MTEPDTAVSRQAIAARDRSRPGKVSGRLKRVLDAMVWEAASRKDAAQTAGMSDHSVRQALKRPHVMAYYNSECEVLRLSGRAKRLHRLDELASQDANKNAAVAAIKVAEGIADEQAMRAPGMQRAPGVVIVIQQPAPPSLARFRAFAESSAARRSGRDSVCASTGSTVRWLATRYSVTCASR